MRKPFLLCLIRLVAVFFVLGLCRAALHAQSDSSVLPDDPSVALLSQNTTTGSSSPASNQTAQTQSAPDSQGTLQGKQTKRILWVIPNFRSVSVDSKLPPQSPKGKFREATQDAFDYSDFIFCAALAGVDQAENSYPEFHQGAAGYGRYFWHTFADQVDEDYQTEFIYPTLLRQDPRFYTLGRGGFAKRFIYAFSRIVITRTDGGNETFNASEIVGAGSAAGISNLYYPSQERTWTKTGQRWVVNIGLDGATYAFQEFWPDINSHIFHQKD